jgi:Arc/MetJ family transcription regulator
MILGVDRDVVHAALPANVKRVFDRPCALRGNAGAKRERDHRDQYGGK